MKSLSPLRSHARSGMMLVEIMFAIVIFLMASAGAILTLVESRRLSRIDRETQDAAEVVQSVLARVRSTPLREIFATFNANGADDPGGAGTAPGNGFDVLGLSALPGDADGRVGEIIFPTQAGRLSENVVDPALGMPRDLDLDGVIDAADHAANYRILPLRVRVQWQGVRGQRTLEVVHFVSEVKD